MHVYGTVVWWKVQVKPDGLPDLFRFKSVDWIIPLNVDRALLSRDKLDDSATSRPPTLILLQDIEKMESDYQDCSIGDLRILHAYMLRPSNLTCKNIK